MNEEITTIEYWYDRRSRNWIVQLKDKDDNQIGEAFYSGTRSDCLSIVKSKTIDYPKAEVIHT